MRILAVDPGKKNIGLAISDPTGTIANPLTVIKHHSRLVDAATVAQIAVEQGAGMIVVGQALDTENQATPQSRRAARFATAIREQSDHPVVLWDESGSTQAARRAQLEMGTARTKRGGHLDALAATYILQTYLDSQKINED
jgi:putative Holliday junction resolvase